MIQGTFSLEGGSKTEKGINFKSLINKREVDSKFINIIEEQIDFCARGGILAGFPLLNVDVNLHKLNYEGEVLPMVSLRQLVSGLFEKIIQDKTLEKKILEPIMDVIISAPSDYSGDVISSLNSKEATILSIESQEKKEIIKATLPLFNLFGYTTELRSRTQGRGQFTMMFREFGPLTKAKQLELLKKLGLIFDM